MTKLIWLLIGSVESYFSMCSVHVLGQKDRPLGNTLLLDSGTFEHSHSFEDYNKFSLYFNPLLLNQEEQVLKYSKVRRGIK